MLFREVLKNMYVLRRKKIICCFVRLDTVFSVHLIQKEIIHIIRRALAGHRPPEAMERLLFFLKKFSTNSQMLMGIKSRG